MSKPLARIEPKTKPLVAESLLQTFANELNRDYTLIKRATYLVYGRRLRQMKAEVGHGRFGFIFRSHPNHIARPVHFSQRTAELLMVIAANELLTDSNYVSILPHSWRVAYALARLPYAQLKRALDTKGLVHPEMQLHEVKYLRGIPRPTEPDDPEAEAKRKIKEAEARIKKTIFSLWSRFRGQRGYLVQLVRDLEIAEWQAAEEVRRVTGREQRWDWRDESSR